MKFSQGFVICYFGYSVRVRLGRVQFGPILFRFVLVTRGDVWKCDVVVLHYTEDAVMNINVQA